MRHLCSALALAVVVAIAASASASAQSGPRYILVYGGGLAGTILLDDQELNAVLISAPDLMPRGGVPREADRPVYELALFFDVPDLTGRSPEDLRPEETAATGRFFPAVEDLEAIFELGPAAGIGPRRDGGVTPEMLDYLVSRGVPVRSDVTLPPPRPSPSVTAVVASPPQVDEPGDDNRSWLWGLFAAGVALAMAAGFLAWRRGRRPRRRGIHF